jgi:hypothetical protein
MSRLALLLLGLALSAPGLLAHDPYESFTLASVRAGDLELNMTIAQVTAIKLIDTNNTIPGLTIENFPKYRDRLAAEARTLWIVTSLKTVLTVTRVTAELTEENDVSFKIYFPKPALGRLHFHAAFLKKLGDGYGGILDTTDTEGRQLGWEQIAWDQPNLEITVLPPTKKK